MTSQLELHYFEDTDNDIVIRAREMSEMVSEMYLFTRYVVVPLVSAIIILHYRVNSLLTDTTIRPTTGFGFCVRDSGSSCLGSSPG